MQRISLYNAKNNNTTPSQRLLWVFGMLLIGFFALSFALMHLVGQTQAASPPSIITYQGKILENGSSVTTSKAMAFLIYDASTGGNILYTASGTLASTSTISVTPTSGIFAVNLGDTGTNAMTSTIFANNTTLYLEVIVDGTTLTPRKRITAAPFATNAQYLLGYSPQTASTSQYIPLSDTDGNLTFTGSPTSTAVDGGVVYINPASATGNFTLFGIALNGNERFRVDEGGNTWIDAALTVSTSLAVNTTSTVLGNSYVGNATEAITTSSFVMNGDDMYVHDLLGVGDSVYIEDSLYIGTSTLRLNGSNAGGVLAMTNGSLTIDSDTSLNINTTNNQNIIFGSGNVGINSTTPASLFSVEGDGYFNGVVTATTFAALSSITLNGDTRTAWPTSSAGGDSAWTTSSGLLYPDNPTANTVLIGASATTTDNVVLEVIGAAAFTGTTTFSATTTFSNRLTLRGNVDNPVLAGSLIDTNLFSNAGIIVDGDYAYISTGNGVDRLSVIDISDPNNPFVLNHVENNENGVALSGLGAGFDVQNDYFYYIINGSFRVLDMKEKNTPVQVATLASGLTSANVLKVEGNYAYAIGASLGVIDISDPYNPTLEGSLTVSNNATYVEMQYPYVFFAHETNDSVYAVDVSDPSNPTLVGTLTDSTNLDTVQELDVQGNYLYATAFTPGDLVVIDISEISNMTIVATSSVSSGAPGDIVVSGDYAYIRAGVGGSVSFVYVFDITSSTNPVALSTISATQGAFNAPRPEIQGNYMYLAGNSNGGVPGLYVVDIGAGTLSGAEIGHARLGKLLVDNDASFKQGLKVSGGASVGGSFLLTGDLGISLATSTASATNSIRFSHSVLFETNATSTDDTGFVFNTINNLGTAADLFSIRDGNTEYFNITGNGTTTVTNLVASGGISLGGEYRTTWSGVGGGGGGGDSAWTTTTNLLYPDNTTDVVVIGKTTTSSASTIFEVEGSSYFNGNIGIVSTSPNYTLSVSGTAYITGATTLEGPLTVLGNVGSPTFVGEYDGTDDSRMTETEEVVVVGDYAYVASKSPTEGGLDIIDVSDPTNPVPVGTKLSDDGTDGFTDLYVAGNYAYAIELSSDTMEVIDISDPSNPTLTNTSTAGQQPADVFVSGNYAYTTSLLDDALNIIDVSDPYNPTFVASSSVAGEPRSLFVSGRYAYVVSDDSDTFTVFDVSDPTNPSLTQAYTTTTLDGPGNLFVSGNRAYVIATNTLHVLDISNKFDITVAASTTLPNIISGNLYVAGDHAYIMNTEGNQVLIYDVSDPSNLYQVGVISNGDGGVSIDNALYLTVAGNYLYVTDNLEASLTIIDITGSTVSNSQIGSARISTLQVDDYAHLQNGLHVFNGLTVGSGGFMLTGDFGINAPTSSISATNTISFSHTALFTSRAGDASTNAFVFDTPTDWTVTSTKYLLSLRAGGVSAFSVATNGDVHASGTLFAESATVGTPGTPGDLAERVDVSLDDTVGPGDVVVVDPNNTDTYRRSTGAYAETVAGIISTNPTLVIGNGKTTSTAVLAMTGRVPIKVTSENGPISRGDLLVTASTTGHAMRYDPSLDAGGRVVGIVGMALDNFSGSASSTQGSILALIRTGWMQNQHQTITEMQSQLSTLAAAQGSSVTGGGNGLNINQVAGQITVTAAGNLDMGWRDINNVMAVRGHAWEIDPQGRFITKVEVGEPAPVPLYAVQSQGTQLILSGSSMLEHGDARIEFSSTTRHIIDPEKLIRVSIALTSESNGMYVTGKSERGFNVRELNNGRTGNATFDWVAIVERRLDVTPQQVQQAIEEAETGSTPPPPPDPETPSSTTTSTPPGDTGTASSTTSGTTTSTTSNTTSTTQTPPPDPSPPTTTPSSTPATPDPEPEESDPLPEPPVDPEPEPPADPQPSPEPSDPDPEPEPDPPPPPATPSSTP